MNALSPRILYVDDHQDTLDLFELVLSQLDYEVVTALSFEQALDEITIQSFDLMVLDPYLADGSGIELCRRIRTTDKTTPILFCSGLGYEKDKLEALNAGAQGYLVKPVNISELCEAVTELILNGRQSPTRKQRRRLSTAKNDVRPNTHQLARS